MLIFYSSVSIQTSPSEGLLGDVLLMTALEKLTGISVCSSSSTKIFGKCWMHLYTPSLVTGFVLPSTGSLSKVNVFCFVESSVFVANFYFIISRNFDSPDSVIRFSKSHHAFI